MYRSKYRQNEYHDAPVHRWIVPSLLITRTEVKADKFLPSFVIFSPPFYLPPPPFFFKEKPYQSIALL